MLIEHSQLKELGIIHLLYGWRHLFWNPKREEVYAACTELLALANIETTDFVRFSDNIPMRKYHPWCTGLTFSGIWQNSQAFFFFFFFFGTSLLLTTEI